MLRLVNAGKVTPVNYLIDSTCPDFEPGQIAEIFVRFGPYLSTGPSLNTLLCKPYCGGTIAGIIDDIKRGTNNSTLSGLITVWDTGPGLVYETDQYEAGFAYPAGANLFADKYSAKFTSNQNRGVGVGSSPIVGAVINSPTATNPLLRFEWFPMSFRNVSQTQKVVSPPVTGPARCKCGYTNEYADPTQPYECYKCRNNI